MERQIILKKRKYDQGYTLIEMLVVVVAFAVLGIMVLQTLAMSLRGSKKGENIVRVKENVDHAISVIDRSLRNAKQLGTPCGGNVVNYIDEYGNTNARFRCITDASGTYIASGAADLRLTNPNEVTITNCTVFTCVSNPNGPDYVEVRIDASARNVTNVEGATYTSTTQILLRNY